MRRGAFQLIGITTAVLTACAAFAAAGPLPADATWPAHGGPVLDIAFSPDGRRLASVGDDGKLKLFDVAAHREIGSIDDVLENQNDVRFTRDGRAVWALGRNDSITRMDADTGKPLPPIALHSVPGGTAAFDLSPDGKTVAVVGRGSLRILSTADGAELQSWEVHVNYGINAVAFSPDGKTVATAATDHKALVIDPATGKIPWDIPLPLNGVAVAFSHDGKSLFVSSSDSTLKSFDLTTGEGKTLIDQKVTIRVLAASPDGKSLYVGGTGQKPWRVALPGGEVDEAPLDGGGWNKAIAVSPDGAAVAGGDNDGAITLWKVAK